MQPFAVRGVGELWLRSLTKPAFRMLMYMQGIKDRTATPKEELDAYVDLLKRDDRGRAFLKIMRGFERTPEKRRLYETAVRDVPYPVQVVWGADDPALRLSLQGQQAQHITGVETLHTLPAKHFLQEDQAPALADHIARHARAASALSRQRTLRAQSPPSSDDPPRAETPWREFRERGESLLAPKWSKQHTTLDG